MRTYRNLLVEMLVYGAAGMVELVSLGAVKSCQPNGVADHGDRFFLWSGFPLLSHVLWRSLWLALTLAVLQLVTPHQGHALPSPIEGTLGGGRVTTGAAPEGVLSAGAYHTCAIKSDGVLTCWGYNGNGQLNNIPGGTFSQVSAAGGHTCGIKSDGTLACWGDNSWGQLNNIPSGTFSQISAGGASTCGLKSNGAIACWGDNRYGQATPPNGVFNQVSAGGSYTCGIKSDGTLACWGDSVYGAPPNGAFNQVSSGYAGACGIKSDGALACWPSTSSVALPPGGTFRQVSVGGNHACGLKSDGAISCWGNNNSGQLNAPSGAFNQISTEGFHTCGLKSDGTLTCWGDDSLGQLTSIPSGAFNRRAVRGGISHTCEIKNDGTLACWGDNLYGQLDNIPSGTFSQVSATYQHACGIRSDGTLACWGLNNRGQATPAWGLFNQLSTGLYHSCGLRSIGTVACWGDNSYGQLNVPSGLFSQISGGEEFTCGIKSDGTLACWGNGQEGQLPPPSGAFRQVSAGAFDACAIKSDGAIVCWGYYGVGSDTPPSGTFSQISVGFDFACGIRSDGMITCWGDNSWGQLDNIPSGTFSQVSARGYHTCAVRSDGTLVCWGNNDGGPAPVPSLTPSSLSDGFVGNAYSQSLALTAAEYIPPLPQTFTPTAGNLPPGVTLSATGLLSGVPTSSGAFSFTVRGEDDNGFTATQNYTLTVSADATPPTIESIVNGTVGTNGWYTSNVVVSWLVVDNESAITMQTGCNSQTVATDTTGMTFTCQATSAGGTASKSITIKRDATGPVLSPTVSPNPVFLNGSATANPGASDAMSGLASASCAPVTTSSVGRFTVACTATDNAGNVANASTSYLVSYQFPGFLSPLPQASYKVGSTIRVKFGLANASGTPIADSVAQGLVAACRVKIGLDTAGNCATYDSRNDVFQFDVKTAKSTSIGTHQIAMQVLASDNSVVNAATTAVTIRP